ncbi:MAG: hypothetical protein WED10_06415 [Brumimicrobium sp.]
MVEAKYSQVDKRQKEISDMKFSMEVINTIANGTNKFINCEFHNISKVVSQGTLTFRNCKFFYSNNSKSYFQGSDSHILFEDCNFNKGGRLYFEKFSDIEFYNCSASTKLIFKAVKSVKLFKCGDEKNGSISNLQFDDTRLDCLYSDCSILDRINILKSFNGKFIVNGGDIGNIEFNRILEKAEIKLSAHNLFEQDLYVFSLVIKDSFFAGKLDLKYLNIEVLEMPNLSPVENRNVLFHNIKVYSRLNLSNSFLDGFTLNDVNLENAELRLGGSFIRNTIFSNIKWPIGYVVNEELPENPSPKEKINYYSRLKEVYQQLKHKSFIDNNRLDGLKFYRNEMDAYFQKIKLDKTESRWSRFLLRVDKLVSNFGQSYMRPLLILLIFHLLISFVIWYLQSGSFLEIMSSSFNEGIWDYVYRLNPIHRPLDDWSKTINGIDAVSRFINGFFIYHFIKAIRRYSKVG